MRGLQGEGTDVEFRHLDYAPTTPVDDLGPAAIEALLERGDLDNWRPLAHAIALNPFGATAATVERVCKAHQMYGTSTLWLGYIRRCRGRRPRASDRAETLGELRRRFGSTQQHVAERMGISQSDVSKIERRKDLRLSTLRAYVEALGGSLESSVRAPDGTRITIAEPLTHRSDSA